MDEFENDHLLDFAVVTYHTWWPSYDDPFWQADSLDNRGRVTFYGVSGTPALKIDGLLTGPVIGAWAGQVASRLAVDAPLTMVPNVFYNPATRTGTAYVTVRNVGATPVSGNFRMIVTESDIHWSAPNGMEVHNFTMRRMVNDYVGDPLSLVPGGTMIFTHPYSLDAGWVDNNCQIIFLAQRPAPAAGNREILQAQRVFFPVDQPYLAVRGSAETPAPGGDGDAYVDAGETGGLVVTLANLNPQAATGTTGTLTTSDPYVTVLNGTASFGTVPGYGAAASTPFDFAVSPGAPSGYSPEFTLTVNAGALAYTRVLSVSADVGSPTDFTGPQGGYYAYENADAGYTETPAYNWVEICPDSAGALPGTLILSVDDGAASYRLPFTFRFHGVNYDSVTVSSNGWLAMGRQLIPDGDSPNPRRRRRSDRC